MGFLEAEERLLPPSYIWYTWQKDNFPKYPI